MLGRSVTQDPHHLDSLEFTGVVKNKKVNLYIKFWACLMALLNYLF